MPDRDRHRFIAAWAAGAALATAAFWWMITASSGALFRREPVNADFYDVQARRLLHGKLSMPPDVVNIEGFTHGAKTYMYFPPVPAILRIPVVAFTDRLDGRLSAASMLLAFTLAMVGTGFLVWRVRELVRGTQPLGRAETVATGLFALLVGMTTPLFFASSRAWVYHEAALWGAAFAICAYDQLIAFMHAPSRARVARAAAFAGAALLSRPTIGAGPVVALALVLVWGTVGRWRPGLRRAGTWFGVPERVMAGWRWVGGLAAAVAVPAAISMSVNLAKFGTPFSVPYGSQVQNLLDPHRRKVLAANDGSLFTPEAAPTQLLQMLRPDGIGFTRAFPWVGFPAGRPSVVGGLLFDRLDPTVSITAGMPVLLAFAVVGIVAVLRRPLLAPMRTCILAALVVLPATLSFLYVAQRYDTDLLPLLLLPGICGFVATIEFLSTRSPSLRRTVLVGFGVLVALGCWTGFATALVYQRSLAPLIPEELRRQYVSWQSDIAAATRTPAPAVSRSEQLPAVGPRDSLAVLGGCDALYVSDGFEWHAVERNAAGGRQRLKVEFPRGRAGSVEALVTAGTGDDAYTVAVEYRGGNQAVLTIPARGLSSEPFALDAGRSTELVVVLDAALGQMRVERAGEEMLGGTYDGPAGPIVLGGAPNDARTQFSGRITPLPTPTPVCDEVVRRAG